MALLGFGVLSTGGGVWVLLQSGGLWEAVGCILFVAMGIAVVATGVIVLLGLRSVGKPGSPYGVRPGAAYGAYGGSHGDGLGGGFDCGGSGFGGGGGC